MLSVERDPNERLVELDIDAFISNFLVESFKVLELVIECLCNSSFTFARLSTELVLLSICISDEGVSFQPFLPTY